jgi:hypothetical protein
MVAAQDDDRQAKYGADRRSKTPRRLASRDALEEIEKFGGRDVGDRSRGATTSSKGIVNLNCAKAQQGRQGTVELCRVADTSNFFPRSIAWARSNRYSEAERPCRGKRKRLTIETKRWEMLFMFEPLYDPLSSFGRLLRRLNIGPSWLPHVCGARQIAVRSGEICEISTDVFSPASRSFMADNNSASGQQVLDDSQAERKSIIQPDCMADYLNWEVMTAIEGISNLAHAA